MRDSPQGHVLQLVEAFLSRSATYKPTHSLTHPALRSGGDRQGLPTAQPSTPIAVIAAVASLFAIAVATVAAIAVAAVAAIAATVAVAAVAAVAVVTSPLQYVGHSGHQHAGTRRHRSPGVSPGVPHLRNPMTPTPGGGGEVSVKR
jgi:hypothetical protein